MARYNGLNQEDQDEIIQEIRIILRNKFKFPFDIRRMTNQGGRELYIFSKDKELEKMKMYFCRDLDFDPDSILGHSDSRDDLAIQINTLRQDLIDSIKTEYKKIINGNHKDLESGHHLLETNGKVVPLLTNEIIPVPMTEYESIIPNPRFIRGIPKFEVQIPINTNILKTEKMTTEKDSGKKELPVKQPYTGAKRGRKSKEEKAQLASLAQNEASAEPLSNVLKETGHNSNLPILESTQVVLEKFKAASLKSQSLAKVPKIKKEPKMPKISKVPKVLMVEKEKKQPIEKHEKSNKEKLVDSYKFKVLSFLTSVLEFENNIKPFGPAQTADDKFCYFQENSVGSYYYLVFRDDNVRAIAYEALACAMDHRKYSRTFHIVKDETVHNGCIGVNFRLMKHWKNDSSPKDFSLVYCMPPKIGATPEEIKKRLEKIRNVSPDIVGSGDSFYVSYDTITTALDVFLSTDGMNWNVSELQGRNFVLSLHSVFEKKKAEMKEKDIIPASAKPAVVSVVKESLTIDEKLMILVHDESIAIFELENIFFDPETREALTPQMQLNIMAVLTELYRKKCSQKYAEHLLKILGK